MIRHWPIFSLIFLVAACGEPTNYPISSANRWGDFTYVDPISGKASQSANISFGSDDYDLHAVTNFAFRCIEGKDFMASLGTNGFWDRGSGKVE